MRGTAAPPPLLVGTAGVGAPGPGEPVGRAGWEASNRCAPEMGLRGDAPASWCIPRTHLPLCLASGPKARPSLDRPTCETAARHQGVSQGVLSPSPTPHCSLHAEGWLGPWTRAKTPLQDLTLSPLIHVQSPSQGGASVQLLLRTSQAVFSC
jgi:hypothetical protein